MEVQRIYFRHYRVWHDWLEQDTEVIRYIRSGKNKCKWTPAPKGGKTEAVALVTYGENTFEIIASTICRPDEAFQYSEGRKYSLLRLNRLLGHIAALESVVESAL